MYLFLIIILLFVGILTSYFLIGIHDRRLKGAISFSLTVIGSFVGVFLAIYLTNYHQEKEISTRALSMLEFAHEEIIHYKNEVTNIPPIFDMMKNDDSYGGYGLGYFYTKNKLEVPESVNIILSHDYIVNLISTESYFHLINAKRNLFRSLKYSSTMAESEEYEEQLRRGIGFHADSVEYFAVLLKIEIEYIKGLISKDQLTDFHRSLTVERFKEGVTDDYDGYKSLLSEIYESKI